MPLFRKSYVVGFVISLMLSLPIQSKDALPPVLDFYPACQYKVFKTVTTKIKIVKKIDYGDNVKNTKPISIQKKTKELIEDIRQKAKLQSADAIILISRKLKQSKMTRKLGTMILSYQAEFIGQCNNLSADKSRPTKFNHAGKTLVMGWNKVVQKKRDIKFTLTNRYKKLHHPTINQVEVSLAGGVYGVKLGYSHQQVREVLGDPSIELAILKNEYVLGYGRSHWFHFQSDKLVKIDTFSSLVTFDIVNRVPFRDFFDNQGWKINGVIKAETPLAEVRASLKNHSQLTSNNQLLLKQNGKQLSLHFNAERPNPYEKFSFSLDGFSLQLDSYKIPVARDFSQYKRQNKLIEQVYLKMKNGQELQLALLKKQLGEPLGKINISSVSELILYNPLLLIESKRSTFTKIHLIESFIKYNETVSSFSAQWKIAELKQGQSLDNVMQQLPEDSFEWNDKVEFELGSFNVSVMFTEKNRQKSLYEMEIEL